MSNYKININGKLYKVKGDMETQAGRKRIFDAIGIDIPKESPTIIDNGFTYTYGSKPKSVIGSETLKDQKVNTSKGIDMYQGKNRSNRYDRESAKMGNTWFLHPLNFIKRGYFNSKIHKAVKEGGDIAAAISSAPIVAYGLAKAAPVIGTVLKTTGQALTPSTWINGIGLAFGYNLDKAGIAADLLLSGYFANEAGREIDKNGLNLKTGFNALMSLAPLTRETEAVEGVANSIRNSISTMKSVKNDLNIQNKYPLIISAENKEYGPWFLTRILPKSMRDIIPLKGGELLRHRLGIGNTIADLEPVPRAPYEEYKGYPIHYESYALNIKPYEELLLDYFNSGFYARRLAQSGLLDQRDNILNHNKEMLRKVRYYLNPHLNYNRVANTSRHIPYKESFGTAISFNPLHSSKRIGYNIYHEGKHAVDINSLINKHNQDLVKEGKNNLNVVDYELLDENDKKYIDYLLSIAPDGMTEMAGLLLPTLVYMQQHNLTADELLKSDYVYKDNNLHSIVDLFKPEYVKRLLLPTGILSTIPLMMNNNDNY